MGCTAGRLLGGASARFQSVWKTDCIPVAVLLFALSHCLALPCPTNACNPTPPHTTPPCCRSEVQDLLTFAAELGLPSPLQAVSDQLAAADGNWEAAHEALQVRGQKKSGEGRGEGEGGGGRRTGRGGWVGKQEEES